MDSIRPDDDELRGRDPVAGKPGKTSRRPGGRKKAESSGSNRKPPARESATPAPGGSGKGLVWLLLALLVVVTMAGAWFGWQMQQRLTVMASQLDRPTTGLARASLPLPGLRVSCPKPEKALLRQGRR